MGTAVLRTGVPSNATVVVFSNTNTGVLRCWTRVCWGGRERERGGERGGEGGREGNGREGGSGRVGRREGAIGRDWDGYGRKKRGRGRGSEGGREGGTEGEGNE